MQPHSKMLYHSNGVGIHVLHSDLDLKKPTLVFLPGLSSTAEDGWDCLSPCVSQGCNVVSMSFRGRGQSTTPTTGYSADGHADDIHLLLASLNCQQVLLIANSISSIYAVQYLQRNGHALVSGLIIVDHSLRTINLPKGWADEFSQRILAGRPVLETIRKTALDGIEKESTALDLYPPSYELSLPILLMAAPLGKGLLTELDLTHFSQRKQTNIVEFKESDHFIRLREPEKFRKIILEFNLLIK